MDKESEWTFSQRIYTDNQQVPEKLLSITQYQTNEIDITVTYHIMPVRMVMIKKIRDDTC